MRFAVGSRSMVGRSMRLPMRQQALFSISRRANSDSSGLVRCPMPRQRIPSQGPSL